MPASAVWLLLVMGTVGGAVALVLRDRRERKRQRRYEIVLRRVRGASRESNGKDAA